MRWSEYLDGHGIWFRVYPQDYRTDEELRKRVMMNNGFKPLTRKERAELKRKDVRW
jgi:hypothetical protein